MAAPARVSSLVTDLLSHERFDLLWATFSAGHFLWDTSQIGERDAVDSDELAALTRTLEDVYEAVDRAIGEILDTLGEDDQAIVLSPIGMGPYTSRSDMLPELLAAVLDDRVDEAPAGSSIFRLRAAVPSSVRAAVAQVLPAGVVHELSARLYLRGVDWSRTLAIALPGEHNGYVRLNLRGRERDGIVAPEEAESLLDLLDEGLATFPRLRPSSVRSRAKGPRQHACRISSCSGPTGRARTSSRCDQSDSASCNDEARRVYPDTTQRARGPPWYRGTRVSAAATDELASWTSLRRWLRFSGETATVSPVSRCSNEPDDVSSWNDDRLEQLARRVGEE